MAQIILRCNHQAVQCALGFLCLLVLVQKGGAYEFVVGGQKGWSVPSDPNSNPYNPWAKESRFQIGDSLVFNYQPGQDSVLQVKKSEDYEACNTDAPIAKFSDGHTVFKFKQSGAHFFISGKKDNCLKNEKIVVIVMADRSNRTSSSSNSTTALSPPSPAPSASTGAAPSPAPTSQLPPSPPNGNPTSSPSAEPSHPNAASSLLLSFAGSLGAFLASALLFSL